MSLDLITFAGPIEVQERSALAIVAKFRDQAALVGVQPTNVYYRLDDEGSDRTLVDWTSVAPPIAPADTVSIAITGDQNRILYESRGIERKVLTVMVNRGLATQFVASYEYAVRNLGWTS
jgi:hypothetical protein